MLCYRDRSYCIKSTNLGGDCKNDKCSRMFTNEDKEEARNWMGENALIAVSDFSDFDCGYTTIKGE